MRGRAVLALLAVARALQRPVARHAARPARVLRRVLETEAEVAAMDRRRRSRDVSDARHAPDAWRAPDARRARDARHAPTRHRLRPRAGAPPAPAANSGDAAAAAAAGDDEALAVAALVAVAVLWGTNFPAVRYLVSDPVALSPPAYAVARFGAAALALAPALPRASAPGALAAGCECGLWIAAGYVAQCLALQSTTAAKGALLAALQVVVVPAAVLAFPSLRPAGPPPSAGRSRKEWACAAAALAGVALLEAEGLAPPVAGDAFAALQPLFFGLSYLRIAAAAEKFPSADDALAMSAAQVAAVAAVALAWFAAAGGDAAATAAAVASDPAAGAVLAWTALASTALTVVLQTYALKRVSAATASLVVSSEPLWAALLAAMLLGETDYGPFDFAGAALVLAASLGPNVLPDDLFARNDDDP